MKSELKESENMDTKKRVYPYIGKFANERDSEDYVCVLFIDKNSGTVVAHGSDSSNSGTKGVGVYSTSWQENCFEILPLTAQIILQND